MGGTTGCHAVGGYDRITLAQLCRGFLLLQSVDNERARSFLVAFLDASQDEVARSGAMHSHVHAEHGALSMHA
jgi:hypothetical protein